MGNLKAMWNYKHGSGYNFYRGYTFPSGGNRLLDIQSGGGSVLSTFAYDAAGNRTQAGTTRFYEWNASDQLRFFKVQNGATPTLYAQYRYEGSGQRLQKLATDQQGNTTLTVYIGGMFEYQKLVKSGTAYERTYTHLMDDQARIATLRHGSAEDDLTESAYYVLADHLGSVSVRLTAGSTGALIDREEYYPYGETSFRTSGKKRYRFTGKEKDAESGLYYYGARHYAPWTATFLSPDPVANSYQGSYLYADANPIVMNDPTGAQSEGKGGNETNKGEGTPPKGETNQAQSKNNSQKGNQGGYNDKGKNKHAEGTFDPETGKYTVAETEDSEKSGDGKEYKGDTLNGISRRFGVEKEKILEANPQIEERDEKQEGDLIYPGEEIKIPKGQTKKVQDKPEGGDGSAPPLPNGVSDNTKRKQFHVESPDTSATGGRDKKGFFGKLWDGVKSVGKSIGEGLSKAVDAVSDFSWSSKAGLITEALSHITDKILEYGKLASKFARGLIGRAFGVVGGLFNVVGGVLDIIEHGLNPYGVLDIIVGTALTAATIIVGTAAAPYLIVIGLGYLVVREFFFKREY